MTEAHEVIGPTKLEVVLRVRSPKDGNIQQLLISVLLPDQSPRPPDSFTPPHHKHLCLVSVDMFYVLEK